MAISKKPRKTYRPKPVRVDPVGYVLAGFKPLGEVGHELVLLRIKNHGALAQMTKGEATNEDFNMLISALNVTEALMLQGMATRWHTQLKAGQEALKVVGNRYKTIKRFVLKGEEMSALNLAMEIHDAQLSICTIAQIERAIMMVRRVVSSGKATSI